MKSLNQIVSENAKLALRQAQEREASRGGTLSKRAVSRRMAQHLPPRPSGEAWKADNVDRMMRDLLEGKRRWNIDLVEAFCVAVGIRPEDILSGDYAAALSQAQASSREHLELALGVEVSSRDALILIGQLRRSLADPDLHRLILEIASALLDAKDQKQADFDVSQLIRARDIWMAAKERKASSG